MEYLKEYYTLYFISQAVALLILYTAWKAPRLGRLLFVLIFALAAGVNSYTAFTTPEVYLDYANISIAIYSSFITGWFSQHIQLVIITIAIGQLLIAIGMLLKGQWVKIACLGAILFFIAIAPLGVGSAFPFSVFTSLAAFLIYKKSPHNFLWKKVP